MSENAKAALGQQPSSGSHGAYFDGGHCEDNQGDHGGQGHNRLAALASEIRAVHSDVISAVRTSLEHAMVAGERLIEAKALVGHGAWLPWLKENTGLSERTAQRYIKLARNRAVLESNPSLMSDLGIAGALEALVTPKCVPPSGREMHGNFEADGSLHHLNIMPAKSEGYYHVLHIWCAAEDVPTSKLHDGADIQMRPVRGWFLPYLLLHSYGVSVQDIDWHEAPFDPAFREKMLEPPP